MVPKKTQACLVTEAPGSIGTDHSKINLGNFFRISRVDTSNALIVVLPRMIPKNDTSFDGNRIHTTGLKWPCSKKG